MGTMLIIMGTRGVSCFRHWAKTLESIKLFFNQQIRQYASFMTHLAFNPVHLPVKLNMQKSLSFYQSPNSKSASGFPLQHDWCPSIFWPYFSPFSLITKYHLTEQIPTVTCTSFHVHFFLRGGGGEGEGVRES